MISTNESFQADLELLAKSPALAIDTETTGLRPFHGDKLIGIGISNGERNFYFVCDLDDDPIASDLPAEPIRLWGTTLRRINQVLDSYKKVYYFHNAKFDLHFLTKVGLEVKGIVHCTKAMARVLHNNHLSYSLDNCAERDLGERKDDRVTKYILENKLWHWEEIPGKKFRKKNMYFHKVPLSILAPYCEKDAELTFKLGELQTKKLEEGLNDLPSRFKLQRKLIDNERDLTKTVYNIERTGLRIDTKYCEQGIRLQQRRQDAAVDSFKRHTGQEFKDSGKLFTEVFRDDESRWGKTKKGNPSFSSEYIKKFEHPASSSVIEYRDAKSKANFLNGFLYWADSYNYIHPTLDPSGTATGRFSSSDPNFQNLEKGNVFSDEGGGLSEDEKFQIRRAIIPREDHCLVMLDYDQMEYRLMLDFARETDVITKVLEGLDVHEATAETMQVKRHTAKTINFMLLYGGGVGKLAEALGCSFLDAKGLKERYFTALPNVAEWSRGVINMAAARGWIFNWAGRKYHFDNSDFSYRAPNYFIQGGCADVVKFAMNEIDRFLRPLRSHIILQVHDEIVLEVHKKELKEIPTKVKSFMEGAYPYKKLPLTVGVEHSWKSLADRISGLPE